MRLSLATLIAVAATWLCACAMANGTGMTPEQAARHIGEHATVCGTIASARYAARSDGQPTFINLDRPYPDQIFTVVIWGDDRGRFGEPPESWHGRLCVTGQIRSYRDAPEIDVTDPAQVRH
jgi:hypothetical protein